MDDLAKDNLPASGRPGVGAPARGSGGDASDDALVEEILDLFAREARIERSALEPGAGVETLGVSSLDLALALFKIEDHFDIDLPEPAAGAAPPTVDEMVQQVLAAIRQRDDRGAVPRGG